MRVLLVAALILAPALLAAAAAPSASAQSGECRGAVCSWSVGEDSLPVGVSWHAEAGEVAPEAVRADGLSMTVVNASRPGTFMLISSPIPASSAGAFSVRLRSDGDLGRFAFLIREEGYLFYDKEGPHADTVLFHPASEEWAFASWAWEAKKDTTRQVRLMLRGEVPAGGTATIEFEDPYFGSDASEWFLDDEREPFAVGPRAERRFEAPGTHELRVARAGADVRRSVTVPAAPPVADFALLPSPVLPGGVRLDAANVSSPFHPNLVRNGDFSRGLAAWTLSDLELGRDAEVAAERGGLRLSTAGASANGTAWALTRVDVTPGVPHEFQWRARDDRGVFAYAVALLEGDGTRHEMRAPPGGEAGESGRLVFTPRTDRVEVQLRVVFVEGVPGAVWFDDVVLRRALDLEWRVGGTVLPDSNAAVRDVRVDRAAPVNVSLTVRDRFGTTATTSAPVLARLPGEALEVRLRNESVVGLAGARVVLDATPTTAGGSFDVLGGAQPWGLWRLEDDESPGNVTLATEGERLALGASNVSETFGAGVSRHLVLPNVTAPYALTFRYRTTGEFERVQAVARFHHPGGAVASEARANLTPSSEWRTGALRLPAAPAEYETLLLGLRGVFKHGGGGLVEFEEPALAPAVEYGWRVANATRVGVVVDVASRDAALVAWNVTAETPGGLTLERAGTVAFLEPAVPYPTLARGVAARWNASLVPAAVAFRLEGPAPAGAAGSTGRVESGELVAGEYRVVAESPGGGRVELGNATIRDRAGLPASLAFADGARAETMRFGLPLPNPELTNATLLLASPLGQDYEVPLAFDATNRTWIAEWRVPRSAFPGTFDVAVRLADDAGANAVVPVGSVRVAISPGDPAGAGWVLLVLATASLIVFWPRRSRVP